MEVIFGYRKWLVISISNSVIFISNGIYIKLIHVGNDTIVESFIKDGGSIDAVNRKGMSILSFAIQQGNPNYEFINKIECFK